MYSKSGRLKNKIVRSILVSSLVLGGLGAGTFSIVQKANAATENSSRVNDSGTEFENHSFHYRVNEDGKTVTLTSYGTGSYPSESAVVPKTVSYDNKEYAVAVIGDHAMSGFTHSGTLKSVTLPEGLEEIDYAGIEDNNLTSINIPSTVKVLKDKAFNNDLFNGLTSVTGGEGLQEIGALAFHGNSLANISFAKMVSPDKVSNDAFSEQHDLKKTVNGISNNSLNHVYLSELLSYPFTDIGISNVTDGVTYNPTEKSFNIPKGVTGFSFEWKSSDGRYDGALYKVTLSPSDIQTKNFTVVQGSTLDPSAGFVKAINSDNSDVSYEKITVDSSSVDTGKAGKYQLTYSFTDKNGNRISKTATVQVVPYNPQPIQYGTVTSHYLDQQGNKISADDVQKGDVGSSYSTTQKNISGYTFSKVNGNSTGTYTNGNTDVTYVYSKNVTPTPTPVKKGQAVYAIKKIGLYSNKNFSKNDRKAWYNKVKRTERPMFVVTGYSYSKNGNLRYKVRDVNHGKKTDKLSGYITANKKYVLPVYYSTLPKSKKVTVINPKGINAYKSVNLTGKNIHYKKGKTLKVVKFEKHNLTTRYVLSNGYYITANKKMIAIVNK